MAEQRLSDGTVNFLRRAAVILGCVFLLLRRSAAFYLFLASLLGVIVTMAHAVGSNTSTVDFTPVFVGTSMSLVVAAFLMWYAKFAERTGWIESTAV